MKKNYFTMVELVVALGILALMMFLVIGIVSAGRDTARYRNFQALHGELLKSNEWGALKADPVAKKELYAAASNAQFDFENSKKLSFLSGRKPTKTTQQKLASRVKQTINSKLEEFANGDMYARWSEFTGNPTQLTRQEFDTLAEAGEIKELDYSEWETVTGNPKKFTEKQFNLLKSKGLITFPEKTSTEKTKTNW